MIAVVQRVTEARVAVVGKCIGEIAGGMVVLVAVEKGDGADAVAWMTSKLVSLRIFRNADKHFDLDIREAGGAILLISNFTVAGETRKGRRPSLDAAASPEDGRRIYDQLVDSLRATGVPLATGAFGADMAVTLTNDGPVTFVVGRQRGTSGATVES